MLPSVTFFLSSIWRLFFSFNDGVCVQVMEKDPRKAATPAKGPANAGTRVTMNRIQSRRERKLALQQDVLEPRCLAQFLSDSVASL